MERLGVKLTTYSFPEHFLLNMIVNTASLNTCVQRIAPYSLPYAVHSHPLYKQAAG